MLNVLAGIFFNNKFYRKWFWYERNCEKEANKVITGPQILRKPFTIVSHYFGICPLSDVSHSLQIILKQMCCG